MRTAVLTLAVAAAIGVAIGVADQAQAGISYATAGSTLSENFNASLPSGWHNGNETGIALQYNGSAHIQSGNTPFPGGWKDDYPAADDTYLGLTGWYLWHDQASGFDTGNGYYSTGGANGHAQFRYGGGNATSGTGFFLFAYPLTLDPLNTEKALGIRSASFFTDSNAGRNSYIGMQLINDTGGTLNSFTITYDGEQYSETTASGQDGFDLQWSLATTAAGWMSSDENEVGGFYDGAPDVDHGGFANSFLSPHDTSLSKSYDGDLPANRVADITHTVSGVEWGPGQELWIRWRDKDVHDGISIDNVRFSAIAASEDLDGDFNDDNIVDGADFLKWQRGETVPPLDANALQDWKDNFGQTAATAAGEPVPEPGALALAAVALLAVGARRRFVA